MINGTIRTLETEREISESQMMLEELLNRIVDKTSKDEDFTIRKGGKKFNVSFSTSKTIWFSLGNKTSVTGIKGNIKEHFWNVFGFDKNLKSQRVEFNIPLRGLNRLSSGLFGKDDKGMIYLLHRGRIGGGKRGVGKGAFNANYMGEKVTIYDSKGSTVCALIGCMTDIDFIDKLTDFINYVKEIKKKC